MLARMTGGTATSAGAVCFPPRIIDSKPKISYSFLLRFPLRHPDKVDRVKSTSAEVREATLAAQSARAVTSGLPRLGLVEASCLKHVHTAASPLSAGCQKLVIDCRSSHGDPDA